MTLRCVCLPASSGSPVQIVKSHTLSGEVLTFGINSPSGLIEASVDSGEVYVESWESEGLGILSQIFMELRHIKAA